MSRMNFPPSLKHPFSLMNTDLEETLLFQGTDNLPYGGQEHCLNHVARRFL
jgi:hypothetical protein